MVQSYMGLVSIEEKVGAQVYLCHSQQGTSQASLMCIDVVAHQLIWIYIHSWFSLGMVPLQYHTQAVKAAGRVLEGLINMRRSESFRARQ